MTADVYITEGRQVRDNVLPCPACGRLIKRMPHGWLPGHYAADHRTPCDGNNNSEKRAKYLLLVDALLNVRCFSCGAPVGRWCRSNRYDGWTAIHQARFNAAGAGDMRPKPQLYPVPYGPPSSYGRA